MISLIKRNLKMFFRSPSTLILSILGAMISFILYLVFLRQTISSNWSNIAGKQQLLDLWLMGGTLAITALTTTLSALDQLVNDKEKKTIKDFYITGLKPFDLAASYFVSAGIIGFVMQVLMFLVMTIYFMICDQITISVAALVKINIMMLLAAFFSSAFNYVFVQLINYISTLAKIEATLGTLTGFLIGVYLPIGLLPNFAQTIIKLYPGAYLASINRHILIQSNLPANFKKQMGIGYNWHGLTTAGQDLAICFGFFIACLILIWLVPKIKKGSAV
ncbi:ABC transporter permease [Xylocopilactobacillus apicola]|uniref:Multidrug ABC transporter permease n=1 Tax=Xylocopilactobacillus apicola TaxID=2932184 RepID=A0AAU9DQ86_9LACO|nr:ABC transporter permease [Xylocopilactobacillus apicola]BDR58024.1 multidrug ABC transporter permease [Xylocopilactobacillus apicola]